MLSRTLAYEFATEDTNPVSVAGLAGNLYVGTSQSGSPDAAVFEVVSANAPTSDSVFDATDDLLDPEYVVEFDGVLYVLDRGNEAIYTVTSGGYTHWADVESSDSWKPMFHSDGSCWVTGFGQNLEHFDDTGTLVATHTDPDISTTLGGGAWIGDLLYMTDGGLDRVVVFDRSDNSFSTVVDGLSSPYEIGDDLTVMGGRLYVVRRPALWSCLPNGTDVRTEFLEEVPPVWLPAGISVIGGALYVASVTEERIYRFSGGGLRVGPLRMKPV